MDPQSRASDAVAEAFAERHGAACARVRITRAQTARIAVMAGLLLLAGWLAGLSPALAIAAAMGGLCLLLIALRSVAILRTLVRDPSLRPGTALPDDRLPGYAVLAPLYREPEVASHLVTALERLDYPRDRLDVQILVEDDDAITRNALAACALPAWMRVTVVPPGSPRTKPRALDHGLATARGDLLTIYDAEDQPEPDQLRLAANAFAELPAAVACLQSRLDHVNARQSLAAGWSCVEYLVWFRVVMPGLAGLGMPLPLGGTSNHFRTAVLRELGGWDPYNVTEDCDLGLRLRRAGYASRMLASTTWEEAVATVPAWIRQRSRWHKGFIQTWLVHARPGGPLRPLGPVDGLWSFLLTGGPVLMLLLQPFAWVATAWWLAGGWDAGDAGDNLSLALTVAGVTGLVAQMLVLATGVAACLALGRPGLAPAAALAPLSWALHSIAAWRALWQMVVQPFAWEKTAHGRSRPDPRLRPWRRAAAALAACLLAGGTGYGLWAAADHRIASDRAARAEAQAEQRRQELARLAEQERRRAAEARRREDEERQRQAVELAAEQQRQRDRERAAAEWLAMPLGMRTQLPQPLLDQERAVVDLVDRSPDRPRGAWRVVAATTAPATVSTLPPLALVQAGRFPGALDLTSRRMRDVAGSAGLAWDVLLPADAPHGMAMTVHLRDEDGRWFQVQPAQHPLPGTWTRFAVPWGDAAGWAGIGHRRPWTREILHRVGELGITLHGSATCAGEVAIANLRLITATPAAGTARLLAPAATVAAVGERWELRFDLAATHANPFDPDTIQVDAVITAPDGQERSFPAFWYQPYERRLEGGRERLDLVGGGEWRVRWRPQQPGLHRWRIRSQDAGGARTDLAGELTALPGDRPGYIRIAATDPTLLERRPGGWFYPIGQNLCQELDLQQPIPDEMPGQDRNGTYTYDRFLDRMGAARMTWFRLWLTPWSFGLEGRRGWPGFHGHGRYSQENAWRLDHVLDRAEALGMAVNLTLTHKSEYALDNCWADAPLNAGQGGPLADRRDFFTDPGVRTSYRKRLRYLVARWGDSPAVMAWELFGEANLVPGYEPSEAADWHRDLARTLQSLDHDRHPVFTHCHNWQVGTSLWELPEIGCVQGNGYIRPPNRTTDHVVNFARYLDEVARFRKPVFVAEYGGRSELGAPSADYLHAQLHSGLWASWTGPFAGAAFPWWWNVTDGLGWYRSFTALVVANAGADRLAHPHRQVRPAVAGDDLAAVGMQAADRGAYWIYGREVFTTVSGRRPRPETTLALTGLRPGAVVLRWFDTMTGTVLDQDGAVIGRDGRLRCRVPPFRGDVALRLDPAPP